MCDYNKTKTGSGFLQDVDAYLKKSHILSNVGSVALPALGGALGLLASPLGSAIGASVGLSGAELLKSQGYGKSKSGYGQWNDVKDEKLRDYGPFDTIYTNGIVLENIPRTYGKTLSKNGSGMNSPTFGSDGQISGILFT